MPRLLAVNQLGDVIDAADMTGRRLLRSVTGVSGGQNQQPQKREFRVASH
jgi:hypothetical protein